MSNFSYRSDTEFQQRTLWPEAKRHGNRIDDPLAELERLRAKTVAQTFGHRSSRSQPAANPVRKRLIRKPFGQPVDQTAPVSSDSSRSGEPS